MKRLTAILVFAGGGILAACGGGQSTTASGGGRVVQIEMRDIAFSSTNVTVTKGETVTFRFTNKGKVVHEALIGDQAAQDAEAMRMSSASASSMDTTMSSMSGMGSAQPSNLLVLDPGKKGDLTYTFSQPGSLIIGCHQPGHYEAGMRVAIAVS